ncbi:carbohydrate-binding module family 12 protein [Exidia glandulosa HHB12029]|uniref:Carbohydrate-binding module family 12 protein n=1 Tax=Exidia glandulosa HHB12029 TaxID=1314781 RepID=A0A166B210_EXIGL|nr:carbohydrate-binding module family 12 protein [Exidia glandulosa HHB12029]
MTQNWEPGVQYNLGDSVEYHGKRYNIIQPHRSQGDWAPDRTPALWGVVPYHDCDDDYKKKHHEAAHNEHPQKPATQWIPPQGQQQQPHAQQPIPAPHQTVPISQEEKKKDWYDLSDDRKKELEVGGGLAAGIALLGAGFAAYKHHEKSEEEKKAFIWGAQNWLQEAQQRTQEFYQSGPRSPVTWILVHGREIPEQALQGGEANGPIYIARTYHEGSIQVGKCSREFRKGAIIGYGHDEIEYDTYEVLVGDNRGVRWVDVNGKLNLGRQGIRPVEAGREADGTPLYVAQAQVKGGTHCGKVSEKLDCAFITADGKEREVDNYRILAYC